MTTSVVYETALVQFRPVVSSEERVNVGVLVFCPDLSQLQWRITDHYRRLKDLYPRLDGKQYRNMRRAFEVRIQRTAGRSADPKQSVMIGAKSLSEIMSVLLPSDGSAFVHSTIRFGHCDDLEARTAELYEEYVEQYERQSVRERIDNEVLWERVKTSPQFQRVAPHVKEEVTLSTTRGYQYTFKAGWQNGHQQLLEPITLDYVDPFEMVDKAVWWSGRLHELASQNSFDLIAIVSDPPANGARQKYDQARTLLEGSERLRLVITQAQIPELAKLISEDVERNRDSS